MTDTPTEPYTEEEVAYLDALAARKEEASNGGTAVTPLPPKPDSLP